MKCLFVLFFCQRRLVPRQRTQIHCIMSSHENKREPNTQQQPPTYYIILEMFPSPFHSFTHNVKWKRERGHSLCSLSSTWISWHFKHGFVICVSQLPPCIRCTLWRERHYASEGFLFLTRDTRTKTRLHLLPLHWPSSPLALLQLFPPLSLSPR